MQGERDHQVRAAVSLANELAVRVRERYPNHVRMIFSLRNYALMIGGVDRLVALKDQTRYLNAWSEEPDGLDELLLEALIDAVFAERYGEIEVGKRRGGIRVPGAALTAPLEAE